MRYDSCRQCIRRRIRCDATAPECSKCRKKGISCSGTGKQYRFITCQYPPHKTTSEEILPVDTKKKHSPAFNSSTTQGEVEIPHQFIGTEFDGQPFSGSTGSYALVPFTTPLKHSQHDDRSCVGVQMSIQPQLSPSLEFLDPKLRMLFAYFSAHIAPAMVVIDQTSNGYRDIILPLATNDLLVQKAVSVVAALHLGRKRNDWLQPAERERSAIIQQLCRDAASGDRSDVFNIQTWATIILLLVGETVTGDQDFVHIYRMLQSFLKGSHEGMRASPDATRFLLQQSQMFGLFTPPSLNPASGVNALEQHFEAYLDFLNYPTEDPNIFEALRLIKRAIYLTRDLYLDEIRGGMSSTERWQAVENIRLLLDGVNEDTPGMHALVWTYFIAGAASSDWEHRKFFLYRLRQVHRKTEMGNIPIAIETLQKLVWCLPPGQNWASIPEIINRVLIM